MVWREECVEVLARCVPEPPDVAQTLLTSELRIQQQKSNKKQQQQQQQPPPAEEKEGGKQGNAKKIRRKGKGGLTKGERALLSAPKPKLRGGKELPLRLRREWTDIFFDTSRHDLYGALARLLSSPTTTTNDDDDHNSKKIGYFPSANQGGGEGGSCSGSSGGGGGGIVVEQEQQRQPLPSLPLRPLRLEDFRVSVDVFRDFRARAALRAAVAADEAFLAAYEGLVKNVVLPFLHANLTEKEADDEDDEDDEDSEGEGGEEAVSYFYQYPPSVRIQPGPSDAFCRAHRDAEYGHQVGEINFWLPLTSRSAYGGGRGGGDEVGVEAEEADDEVAAEGGASQTSRSGGRKLLPLPTLWVESAPDAGDFHPLEVSYGAIAAFHGTLCRHSVPPNGTDSARMSMDFRVGVGRYFDPAWRLPGVKASHAYREANLAK